MKKNESQEIFRQRSKSANLKINQWNKYETFECDTCTMEEEILKMKEDKDENKRPSYNWIFNKKIKDQIEIARSFSKKMKIIVQIRKSKSRGKRQIFWRFKYPVGSRLPTLFCVCSITDVKIYYYYYYEVVSFTIILRVYQIFTLPCYCNLY